MATLAMIVGTAIVNGLAFSGSNYLFSNLEKSKESQRHNLAMENLTKDQETYEQNRLAQLDFINEKLQQENHANTTFTNVDDALQKYYEITGKQPIYAAVEQQNNTITETTELILITVGVVFTYYLTKKYFNK